jgi:hypothetical protein|tara:strand:- start:5628 stop:6506 length:879 start_codon:yes stop_codon:yes gene_type:complete
MAVEIKGGNSTDLAGVFPVGKGLRVTNVSSEGIEGFQSLPIAIPLTEVSDLNNDLLASLDVSQYKFISLQLTGNWVGTISFQGSNDGGTFFPIVTSNPSGGLANGETSTTVNRLVKVPTVYRFVRIRVTAYTSGIVEGVAFGHRDENSSGLISAIGPVTLNAETTKKIGNVGIIQGSDPDYEKIISTTTTNATAVSGVPVNVSILHLVNTGDGVRFVKLYNKASAPTVGTDVPLITIGIPAVQNSSFMLPALQGINFSIGLSYAITLGAADSDTTALTVAANVTGLIAYSAL